jgi:hypothetical protein
MNRAALLIGILAFAILTFLMALYIMLGTDPDVTPPPSPEEEETSTPSVQYNNETTVSPGPNESLPDTGGPGR